MDPPGSLLAGGSAGSEPLGLSVSLQHRSWSLEGEEFLWLLAFQQMETVCVCCPAAFAVLCDNTVKGAEGFDVERWIFSPYLCKMFAKIPAETEWVYFKIFLAITRQPDLV